MQAPGSNARQRMAVFVGAERRAPNSCRASMTRVSQWAHLLRCASTGGCNVVLGEPPLDETEDHLLVQAVVERGQRSGARRLDLPTSSSRLHRQTPREAPCAIPGELIGTYSANGDFRRLQARGRPSESVAGPSARSSRPLVAGRGFRGAFPGRLRQDTGDSARAASTTGRSADAVKPLRRPSLRRAQRNSSNRRSLIPSS